MAGETIVLGTAEEVAALRTLVETYAAGSSEGRSVFSADGTTVSFVIPHGLAAPPSSVQVTPGSLAAAGAFYVTTDGTNLTVTYLTAPASGAGLVTLNWVATL